MKTLVKFTRDWADEFDIDGFVVLDAEGAERLKEHFSQPRTVWFGTNEGWDDEVLIDSFTFVEITDEEAVVINRLFPGSYFGFIPEFYNDDEYDE